jgi:diketogulonate reductase-like aldo/keto reductase
MKCPWIIYGTAWKKEKTSELVESAVLEGFRAIDTANQLKHYYEEGVGEAIKRLSEKGIKREDLFPQSKFTSPDGQGDTLPYNKNASIKHQVFESFESSLIHLGTDYLDSYLLHGPYGYPELQDEDWEVWSAMEELYHSGKAKSIGISNVNAVQLEALVQKANVKPQRVQNRCYANRGWDKNVRGICREKKISYQAFSLLTANPEVLENTWVVKNALDKKVTPEQIVFAFATQMGMFPLTGTTDPIHMKLDLKSDSIKLTKEELSTIEKICF